ncbi:hypothetical protein CASFOL_035278 [Castilleja foliolosa]|uniref:Uncharacterized protein n=1 Tax=Castilleja foliolosa TaxID=1961234 RepID=A0ABD3BTR9_9LAMI
MQQYNQMISNRSVPQPNASASGALPGTDCGARMLPGGNGMGLASGVNRSMPMARLGFQIIASSPIVNSGSMVSPGMPSANMHSGVGPSQGRSVLRPREPLQMMRESSRPMMPDHQMQASAVNSQVPHFGGSRRRLIRSSRRNFFKQGTAICMVDLVTIDWNEAQLTRCMVMVTAACVWSAYAGDVSVQRSSRV